MLRNITIAIIMIITLALGGSPAYCAAAHEGVTFNLSNVEIANVAKFVSDVTGKNFMFDERVTGKITIIAPTKISADDAFKLFVSVLRLKGFALVPSGVDAYKIVPAAEARQSGIDITTDKPPVDDNTVARLISLQYISADEAMKFLQPVISKTGHISSFGPGNLLLVVDSGMVVDRTLKLIENIDLPAQSEEPDLVFLINAGAETVATLINDGISRSAAKKATEQQARAVADKRLNAVVLFGDRSAKEGMKRLIQRLDVKADSAQGAINVYFLEHAAAEDIFKVLENLRKGTQETATSTKAQSTAPGAPAVTPQTRSPFEAASGINITPDKATNSLIIIASPADYASLVQVIKQLDRRRKQVYVEAMVVEASVEKTRELGSNWRALAQNAQGEPYLIGGVGTIDTNSMTSIVSGLSGMTVGGLGNFFTVPITQSDGSTTNLSVPGYAALFSASIFENIVNVLSTPQILTSDNTEAQIIVGENVPFITSTDKSSTSGDVVSSSVERKDVGITLKITPQITEGDYVKLDVYQEISSVKDISSDIYVSIVTSVGPTTTKRSTKTNVVVRDAQTVVIGGLMQEKEQSSTYKVPWLGDIPYLGYLFKVTTKTKEKTNLLVFLTPHIIRDSKELAALSARKRSTMVEEDDLHQEGELMVKFNPSVAAEKALEILRAKGVTVIGTLSDGRYLVKALVVENTLQTMHELMAADGVADVVRRLKTESLY